MKRRLPVRSADLRGAVRLAAEATAGLTDLVEAMHERIARLPGVPASGEAGRTRGITGLVYKSIRGVTRLVGGSVDALLGLLTPALSTADSSREREAVVAALNGVLGDHLAASANPLAIGMAFRSAGTALPLDDRSALAAALPAANGRVLVLLHGLCMNDLQWTRDGHDHGAALARDLGFTPVYLHYNSGLPIGANGRELAGLLEQLLANWPLPVERLVLLGHSMGGLVARSALHHGALAGCRWPARVDDVVFLGTPHHGAPLERAGHGVDVLLEATPYAAPFARLGKLRSAGITDLRHGCVVEGQPRQAVPLPSRPRCHAIAANTGPQGGSVKARLIGDGLVPVASALGRHKDAARQLAFAPERQAVVYGCNHMALLSHAEVYALLREALARP